MVGAWTGICNFGTSSWTYKQASWLRCNKQTTTMTTLTRCEWCKVHIHWPSHMAKSPVGEPLGLRRRRISQSGTAREELRRSWRQKPNLLRVRFRQVLRLARLLNHCQRERSVESVVVHLSVPRTIYDLVNYQPRVQNIIYMLGQILKFLPPLQGRTRWTICCSTLQPPHS